MRGGEKGIKGERQKNRRREEWSERGKGKERKLAVDHSDGNGWDLATYRKVELYRERLPLPAAPRARLSSRPSSCYNAPHYDMRRRLACRRRGYKTAIVRS